MPHQVGQGVNLGVDQLTQIQQRMGDNEHVTSKLTAPVYAKANGGAGNLGGMPHEAKGFWEKSEVSAAKGTIHRVLTGFVGKKAADKIFSGRNIAQYESGKFLGKSVQEHWLKPEGTAVSKLKLKSVLSDAQGLKADQMIREMKPDHRKGLADRAQTMSPLEILRDPELGPIYFMQAGGELSTENLEFIQVGDDFDQLLQEYDRVEQQYTAPDGTVHDTDNRLADLRNQLQSKLTRYAEMANSGDINVGYSEKKGMNRAIRRTPIANMQIGDFRTLFRGAANGGDQSNGPVGKMQTQVTSTSNDIKTRLIGKLSGRQLEVAAANPNQSDLDELSQLAEKMTADDHIRLKDGLLYAKAGHGVKEDGRLNHGKTHFWNSRFWNTSRAKKFAGAKNHVLDMVVKATGDSKVAERIMKPFLKSSRALTKADLTRILSAAKTQMAMTTKVDALIRSDRPNPPSMAMMLHEDNLRAGDQADSVAAGWADAFADFCDAKESTGFNEARQLSRLGAALRSLPGDAAQLNTAKQAAREVLEHRNLPSSLQQGLRAFVARDSPHRNEQERRGFVQLQQNLAKFQAETTGISSETGKLLADFRQYAIDAQKNADQEFSVTRSSVVSYDEDDVSISEDQRVGDWDDAASDLSDQDVIDPELNAMQAQAQQLAPDGQPIDNLNASPASRISREGDSIREYLSQYAQNGFPINPSDTVRIEDAIELAEQAEDPEVAQEIIVNARNMAISAVSLAIANSDD